MPTWIALALCAVGLATLAIAARQSTRGRATRSWTRTTGRVLLSRVEKLNEEDDQHRARWGFVVRYAYEARGARHESDQVWIGSRGVASSEDEEVSQGWAARFPAGSEPPVWFDPFDPRQAVLVQGVPATQLGGLVVGGLLALGAGIFALSRDLPR
jgi:hypothetical protein